MADSIAVLSPVDRVTSAGASVSGAKLKFYVAGTSTPLPVFADQDLTVPLGATVYCDSDGFPVTSDGGTTKTAIFTGAASYKVIVTDADDVALITLDNLRGATDTSAFSGGGEVNQSVPVVAKSSSYTFDEDTDNGKLFDFTTTGGDCTGTLPSAIDAGDGYYVGLRHNGTANELIIETVSSQTIRHLGAATDALALTGRGETIWLASDGANWVAYGYVPPLISAKVILTIADRLSAPPVTPVAGARYILTSSPSGAWSSFAEHDIVESDGSGSWVRRTPPTDCGWIAYVQDEDANYQYRGSAWVAFAHAASDTLAGVLEIADVTEMEAGTATDKAVTPGRQHRHPLHPKAWALVAGTGASIIADQGFDSVSDDGSGLLTMTMTTAMANTNYIVAPGAEYDSGNSIVVSILTKTTTTFRARGRVAASNAAADPDNYSFIVMGDQ
jgi:hypothetical protein